MCRERTLAHRFLYIPPDPPPCDVPRLSDRTDDEVCLRPEPC